MTVYALLKGSSAKGLVTFHGITSSQSAANTWEAAGKSHWYWECTKTQDGQYDYVQSEPFTCGV